MHRDNAMQTLLAVRGIAEDSLRRTDLRNGPVTPTPLDLAADIRRLGHMEFVHHLRCDATRPALLLIVEAVDHALVTIGTDERLAAASELAEPFRHRMYATMTAAALRALERARLERLAVPPNVDRLLPSASRH